MIRSMEAMEAAISVLGTGRLTSNLLELDEENIFRKFMIQYLFLTH